MDTQEKSIGIEVGAVSLKWVEIMPDGSYRPRVTRHGGNPASLLKEYLEGLSPAGNVRIGITGAGARHLLDLPYYPETESLEKVIAHHRLDPDILVSLGGETFSVYPVKDREIRNIIATSKCAAGTGEFVVQQFQRMGLNLESGLKEACKGQLVDLATRCSVHCKSDATHKLNKGECSTGDIARSLIWNLAKRVGEMIESANWPASTVILSGGVTANKLFTELFRQQNPSTRVVTLPEGTFMEAYGAALLASEAGPAAIQPPAKALKAAGTPYKILAELGSAGTMLDYSAREDRQEQVREGGSYILGVDAGSTTTKAVLYDPQAHRVDASVYLRTLGNPVEAARNCLKNLQEKTVGKKIRIIAAGVTGSGREMVSVYLNNCLSFNEILTHARAAAFTDREVDTVFEIGGQDSKFISFQAGIPVDYAMNEGCSAGTGSFLEESAYVDMGIPVRDISSLARKSRRPIAFGERCAAFIDTDIRNALQQGAKKEDVLAGLVYSIAENYISRIVGPRRTGDSLMFLGGVALNRAVAQAMALVTGKKVIVPRYPELMGCVGSALMVTDELKGGVAEASDIRIGDLVEGRLESKGSFTCKTCDNLCEIQKINIDGKTYPFGGLCSLYENRRRGKDSLKEGNDLIGFRNNLMFGKYTPAPPARPKGRIGIPMALTAWELFPLYAKLVSELGYEPVPSEPSREGNTRRLAPACYPCELYHGAVYDLVRKGVDHILIPRVIESNLDASGKHGYTCATTGSIPDIISAAFDLKEGIILSPHMGLREELMPVTINEVIAMGKLLGAGEDTASNAFTAALDYYMEFRAEYTRSGSLLLEKLKNEPSVILAGRPYTLFPPDVNLALPRKITSRGYHAIPMDLVPEPAAPLTDHNVWHYTRQINRSIEFVKQHPEVNICLVSCFSCGPDAEIYHHFRRELSGETFCYLEIDSHTAHAGFETRLGAFLDIVELRKSRARDLKTV